jgi:hypothetical protein
MGPLAAVEHFLERLFERQSARLFRTRLRPIVVLRRVERTMEDARAREGGRTVVPHRIVVRLHPDDLAALRAASPDLAARLADGALAFARHHGYTLLDRPTVTIRPDARVQVSDVLVDTTSEIGSDGDAEMVTAAPPDEPVPLIAGDQTAVFVVPRADGPHATLRVIGPDGVARTVEFDGRPLTVGRAPDNGIVLDDGRASRHHARHAARRGAIVLSDSASTNGSWVNDRRVESVALGEGDRLRLGATTIVVEAIELGDVADEHPPAAGRARDGGADPRDGGADLRDAVRGAVTHPSG